MSRTKKYKKAKLTITNNDMLKATKCGDFQANKDIANLTKSSVYKSKKAYSRKAKHRNLA